MFAANQKLSTTGLSKLFITETLGLSLIFAMYFADRLDIISGSIIFTGIFIFSCIYLKLIFHLITHSDEKKLSKTRQYIRIKSFIKAFLFLTFSTLMLVKYVHEQILFHTNTLFITFLILLFALPISRAEIEVRGRLCELLYLFVLLPILGTIIYQFCTIDFQNISSLLSEKLLPDYSFRFLNILKLFLTTLISFLILCPWGYLLLEEPIFHLDENEASAKNPVKQSILRTSFFIYLITMAQFIISCLTYHVHPVLSIVISLMIYIATSLHYCTPKKRKWQYTSIIAGFLFTGSLLLLPSALQHSSLFTFLSEINFDRLYDSSDRIIDAKELENRSFVLSVCISSENGELLYTCELADTQTEEISSAYVTVSNLESFMMTGGKPFDFSHMEALVLDGSPSDGIWKNYRKEMTEVIENYRIPGSALVFFSEDIPEAYELILSEKDNISVGKTLRRLAKNQKIEKKCTIRNLMETG